MTESSLATRPAATHYRMAYLWTISLVAALGGLLFGYDWVVIGGTEQFYEAHFGLVGDFEIGWAMSCALLGCLIGSVLAGTLSDAYGRKRLLIFAGMLFVATGVGVALANSFAMFVLFRILGGIGIGVASNISPMYIAEVSPATVRGKFVSLNQLTIVIGILLAQIVNWLIAMPVPSDAAAAQLAEAWNNEFGWRWMFGAVTVPGSLFFVMMFLVPESPRWLVKNGKDEKARDILAHIGGGAHAEQELVQIKQSLVNDIERVNFGELLEPRMLKILLLGVTLAVLQQWCGINVIFNYAKEVFKAAGYNTSDTLANIVRTGVVNLVFTFVAIFTVDRLGRRTLMLAGEAGLALIFAVLGYCYYLQDHGSPVTPSLMLGLVLAAIACYACTLAPVTWVVLSEIFPNRTRGAAMAVSVFALWVGCFALTYSFPSLNSKLGAAGTFWIYGVICVAGFLFMFLRLPETKGKSLEQIERELVN
jgi:MFS transporter, SP family, arabinose:H+ symporter